MTTLREGKVGKRIVPLNDIEEAFELFMALLIPSVIDVRGEEVSFDIGDYVHNYGRRTKA